MCEKGFYAVAIFNHAVIYIYFISCGVEHGLFIVACCNTRSHNRSSIVLDMSVRQLRVKIGTNCEVF